MGGAPIDMIAWHAPHSSNIHSRATISNGPGRSLRICILPGEELIPCQAGG